jgi:hypothetical protein
VRVPDAELWQPRQETTRFWVSARIRAFGFLESASETSHLGGLLHEKVKESFKVFGLSGKPGLVSTSYLHFKRFTFNMYSRT